MGAEFRPIGAVLAARRHRYVEVASRRLFIRNVCRSIEAGACSRVWSRRSCVRAEFRPIGAVLAARRHRYVEVASRRLFIRKEAEYRYGFSSAE